MSYRLVYGFLVILLLALLAVMLGLRTVPFWQARIVYAPVVVDEKKFAITWAVDRGTPAAEVSTLPVSKADQFRAETPDRDIPREVHDYALKILVKEKLPETTGYVVRIRGNDDSVMLPLERQNDGTYATSEFIPLADVTVARYFHGVRVFHIHSGDCYLAVEKVVAPLN